MRTGRTPHLAPWASPVLYDNPLVAPPTPAGRPTTLTARCAALRRCCGRGGLHRRSEQLLAGGRGHGHGGRARAGGRPRGSSRGLAIVHVAVEADVDLRIS